MRRKLFYITVVFIFIFSFCVGFYYVNYKKTVAIIGAMDEEINEIYTSLKNPKTIQKNDFVITTGKIGNNNLVLAQSGVGKVASATTTQYIIDNYKLLYIVNIGIAGSASDNMKAGDIIIAEKWYSMILM